MSCTPCDSTHCRLFETGVRETNPTENLILLFRFIVVSWSIRPSTGVAWFEYFVQYRMCLSEYSRLTFTYAVKHRRYNGHFSCFSIDCPMVSRLLSSTQDFQPIESRRVGALPGKRNRPADPHANPTTTCLDMLCQNERIPEVLHQRVGSKLSVS